jgi:hypothetical protein
MPDIMDFYEESEVDHLHRNRAILVARAAIPPNPNEFYARSLDEAAMTPIADRKTSRSRRPSPRISRIIEAPMRRRDRPRAIVHLRFIQDLSCLTCGRRPPSQAAHVRTGTDGAMATKPSDRFTVPLCADCHARQHRCGELTFWSTLGIDPVDRAIALWAVSGDEKAAQRILFRARQRIALAALRRKANGWL